MKKAIIANIKEATLGWAGEGGTCLGTNSTIGNVVGETNQKGVQKAPQTHSQIECLNGQKGSASAEGGYN